MQNIKIITFQNVTMVKYLQKKNIYCKLVIIIKEGVI